MNPQFTIPVIFAAAFGPFCDPGKDNFESEYKNLIYEYQNALRHYSDSERMASDEKARKALFSSFPKPIFQDRFILLARKYPGHPGAIDALAWILKNPWFGDHAGTNVREAIGIIRRDYLKHPRVGRACEAMAYPLSTERAAGGVNPAAEQLLRDVLAGNPDRDARGRACYSLATYLNCHSRWRSAGMTEEESRRLRGEAMSLFERVIGEYADLTGPYRGTLGDLARAELFEIRNLVVGRVAPEIEGKDAAGATFRLSDYRGNVVLLTFSGNWCGPCRAMYPRERSIVERFRRKRFVLLSVNTDADKATLDKSIASGEITWRCWRDGGPDGPITSQWGVETFPTLYLVDQAGVIRKKGFAEDFDLQGDISRLLDDERK